VGEVRDGSLAFPISFPRGKRMRLLGLDFETTGLDPKKDRIIELGAVLWEVEGSLIEAKHRPLLCHDIFLYERNYPKLEPIITDLTGITQEMLEEFGRDPGEVLSQLNEMVKEYKVDYIVAHNGTSFDRPFLQAELARSPHVFAEIQTVPWIDTRTDLPFEKEPDSVKLKYLAADHGFINPFAHRAMFDVLTMLVVMSKYNMQEVVARSKVPNIKVKAMVSFSKKDIAKQRSYHWDGVLRVWHRTIKEDQWEDEVKYFADHGVSLEKMQ